MTQKLLKKVWMKGDYVKGIYTYDLIRRWGYDYSKVTKYFIRKRIGNKDIKYYNFNVVCKLKPIGS